MLEKIKARAQHNLFSFHEGNSVQPVTYSQLMKQMRTWLEKAGVQHVHRFTSHSMRQGGSTEAFENGVPEITIKTLGNWASSAYCRYIDITLDSRLRAYMVFNNF